MNILSKAPRRSTMPSRLGPAAAVGGAAAAGHTAGSGPTPTPPPPFLARNNRKASRITLQDTQRTEKQLKGVALVQVMNTYRYKRLNMKKALYHLEMTKRNKFSTELLQYIGFLTLLLAVLFTAPVMPVHYAYEQNAMLRNLYFDNEFANVTFKKNFDDVMVAAEFWQWVEGPFMAGLYDAEDALSSMALVGGVQFRQVRVKPEVCAGQLELFNVGTCYPQFSEQKEARTPFGAHGQYVWSEQDSTLYRSAVFTPSVFNAEQSLGTGGYSVVFPPHNQAAAQALVQQMKTDFLDLATRAVAVSFSYFNPSTDMVSTLRILFDFSATRFMEKSPMLWTFRLAIVDSPRQVVADHIAFWLFVVVLTSSIIAQLRSIASQGLFTYLKSYWNLLDIIHRCLMLVFVLMYISYFAMSSDAWAQILRCSTRDCFVDLQPLALFNRALCYIAAVSAALSSFKVFKYLRLNARMNLLWRTLGLATPDLLAFFIIFMLVLAGYTSMAYVAFGPFLRDFHAITTSFWTCFTMILGAFNYDAMVEAEPRIAPWFFVSFMVMVYITFLNMFIAIINDYYTLAQNEKQFHQQARRSVLSDGQQGFHDDIEYDLARRFAAYIRSLVPVVSRTALKRYGPAAGKGAEVQQIFDSGAIVYLVDASWLTAERKRLRSTLRSVVLSIRMTQLLSRGILLPPVPRQPLSANRAYRARSMGALEMKASANEALEADALDATAVDVELPPKLVRKRVYIPMTANGPGIASTLLHQLLPGDSLVLFDKRSTREPVTLQVVGNVPSSSNEEDDDDDAQHGVGRWGLCSWWAMWCSRRNTARLPHVHSTIGDGAHIRRCRVIIGGTLDGLERANLPARAWLSFVLWQLVRYVWSNVHPVITCRHNIFRRRPRRLLSEAQMEQVLRANAHGRGNSCRFDELVSHIRMCGLQNAGSSAMGVDVEAAAVMEAKAMFERFSDAVSEDAAVTHGDSYTPNPIDTSNIKVPSSLLPLCELIATHCHEVWSVGRIAQGWKYGPQRDNDKKLHPELIPYGDLQESAKQYDRDSSFETIKVILAMGYRIQRLDTSGSHSAALQAHSWGKSAPRGATYEPKPFPVHHVQLPPAVVPLMELLAENSHEVWAKARLKEGWRYGPQRDDGRKLHNCLLPYSYLPDEEHQFDRNTAKTTLQLILGLGYAILAPGSFGSRVFANQALTKSVGRSENASTRQLTTVATVARQVRKLAEVGRRAGSVHATQAAAAAAGANTAQLEYTLPAKARAGLAGAIRRRRGRGGAALRVDTTHAAAPVPAAAAAPSTPTRATLSPSTAQAIAISPPRSASGTPPLPPPANTPPLPPMAPLPLEAPPALATSAVLPAPPLLPPLPPGAGSAPAVAGGTKPGTAPEPKRGGSRESIKAPPGLHPRMSKAPALPPGLHLAHAPRDVAVSPPASPGRLGPAMFSNGTAGTPPPPPPPLPPPPTLAPSQPPSPVPEGAVFAVAPVAAAQLQPATRQRSAALPPALGSPMVDVRPAPPSEPVSPVMAIVPPPPIPYVSKRSQSITAADGVNGVSAFAALPVQPPLPIEAPTQVPKPNEAVVSNLIRIASPMVKQKSRKAVSLKTAASAPLITASSQEPLIVSTAAGPGAGAGAAVSTDVFDSRGSAPPSVVTPGSVGRVVNPLYRKHK